MLGCHGVTAVDPLPTGRLVRRGRRPPARGGEQALAHALPDKVEAAYRRGDMLEKRRRLMQEWAAFCA